MVVLIPFTYKHSKMLTTFARAIVEGLPDQMVANIALEQGISLMDDDCRTTGLLFDEVDPDINLVKGRGGALLREKMVEAASISLLWSPMRRVKLGLGGSGLAVQ
ncbi:hypothetical protein HPP92_000971 [Vanilla planifolia]|uniref:Uncharacterized protein n=1 Tax=Vanilla planifolia TaxID=51239 RepID=A0A835RPV2_VANPL|nr:hypothetical protein HPP92_000971 [Vanilla planifolia]